jgi:hypothetical protein
MKNENLQYLYNNDDDEAMDKALNNKKVDHPK